MIFFSLLQKTYHFLYRKIIKLKNSLINVNVLKAKYVDFLIDTNYSENTKSKDFVDYTNSSFSNNTEIKLIAFYLPQFHTIPLNDKYYGKGFTEWRNVAKTIPQYTGHYQPHIPIDLGFYDLSNPSALEYQCKLAQQYGIYAFCYHYYWFSGTRLLEKPLFDMLHNPAITMPFCLCWANENWSALWDGGNKKIIQQQKLEDNDDEFFFNDILPFFKDSRYIKINNAPLLIIYRPSLFPIERFQQFIKTIRNLAKKNGFPDLYILCSNFLLKDSPQTWDLDGIVEFPPHGMQENGLIEKDLTNTYVNPHFKGFIFNIANYINNKKYLINTPYNLFKTVFPMWDNTARKAYSSATVFDGMTPTLYKSWLKGCIEYTQKTKEKDSRFVFINAWNEWAEGAHLEPDIKHGYAYLQATKEVLEELKEN